MKHLRLCINIYISNYLFEYRNVLKREIHIRFTREDDEMIYKCEDVIRRSIHEDDLRIYKNMIEKLTDLDNRVKECNELLMNIKKKLYI